jgi:hypothetical protein
MTAIRDNDLYVLTHPEYRDGIEEHFRNILAAMTNRLSCKSRCAICDHRLGIENALRGTWLSLSDLRMPQG